MRVGAAGRGCGGGTSTHETCPGTIRLDIDVIRPAGKNRIKAALRWGRRHQGEQRPKSAAPLLARPGAPFRAAGAPSAPRRPCLT